MWKVLIADDEELIVRSMKRLVKWEEHDLELSGTAGNGTELLEKIEQIRPDIVIVDICMPSMTGLDVIAKTFELGLSPRFIIISAYTTFAYARIAIQLGVDEFLPKPVTAKSINEALERAMRKLDISDFTQKPCNRFITVAVRYIDQNFDKPLSLTQVAEYVYLSPTYFSALFKKEMKQTFSDYLTKVRIEHTKVWLNDLQYSLEDIAGRAGYSNAKYFGKVFKAVTGVTPVEWRNRKRQET